MEEALNKLGEQGWELLAVTGGQPFVVSPGTVGYADTVYYLKRPK